MLNISGAYPALRDCSTCDSSEALDTPTVECKVAIRKVLVEILPMVYPRNLLCWLAASKQSCLLLWTWIGTKVKHWQRQTLRNTGFLPLARKAQQCDLNALPLATKCFDLNELAREQARLPHARRGNKPDMKNPVSSIFCKLLAPNTLRELGGSANQWPFPPVPWHVSQQGSLSSSDFACMRPGPARQSFHLKSKRECKREFTQLETTNPNHNRCYYYCYDYCYHNFCQYYYYYYFYIALVLEPSLDQALARLVLRPLSEVASPEL